MYGEKCTGCKRGKQERERHTTDHNLPRFATEKYLRTREENRCPTRTQGKKKSGWMTI